jgi:hypothetical protein
VIVPLCSQNCKMKKACLTLVAFCKSLLKN